CRRAGGGPRPADHPADRSRPAAADRRRPGALRRGPRRCRLPARAGERIRGRSRARRCAAARLAHPHPRRAARSRDRLLRNTMAILLAQLGRLAYRRAVPVLIAWLLIAAGTVIGGIALGGTMQDSFKIPGTESQQAIDRLAAVFPQTAGASGQLVVHSTDASIADLESELDDLATRLGDV